MNNDESKVTLVVVNGWMLCSCGKKHRLIPAIDAPVYWCGNELQKLKEGDDVKIEEVESDEGQAKSEEGRQ